MTYVTESVIGADLSYFYNTYAKIELKFFFVKKSSEEAVEPKDLKESQSS